MAEPFLAFRPARIADQAADALRDGIHRGAWGHFLPGEFELARRLGIGRSSVHAALAQLAKGGLVEIKKGRRCQIRVAGRRRIDTPTTVCLVAAIPRENLSYGQNPVIPLLHAQFSDCGIAWEQTSDFSFGRRPSALRLGQLVSGRRNVCWLLFGVSASIQRWFEKSGARTLVVGHCHPSIKLPSVDINYRAVGWHAAGCMARKGHQHVACVLPYPATAGDIACRDGFFDRLGKAAKTISVSEIARGESRSALIFRIDRMLRQNPRPTAILSVAPENTLAIFAHLMQSGLKLPDDISLIGADSHGLLDGAVPGLTRYCVDIDTLARRVVRITHSVMAGNPISLRPSLIVPRFITGETLGPPPIDLPVRGRAVSSGV